MSIQLLFKQATGNIPADKFWVGFVVRFWHIVHSQSVPCCRALEITSLGLTMAAEKRERDGFSFPVLLQHKNRFDKKVVPRFYVGIEDPERVFADCKFVESVDLVFAAKDGLTLAELGGPTSVTVFSPAHVDGLSLEIYEGREAAVAVKFALIEVENGARKFCDVGKVVDLDGYPGDIESYCHQHATNLDSSTNGSFRPIPADSVAPGVSPAATPSPTPAMPNMQATPSTPVIKGGNVLLTKIAPDLEKLSLQLGWRTQTAPGIVMDLDASAFMLAETGKVRSDDDFIFYGQPVSACSSVVLALGDPDQLQIDLAGLPRAVVRVVICVTIDQPDLRRQSFSQVNNAFVRTVDRNSDHELCRFDLVDVFGAETSMIFCEIYRYKDGWKFKAVGQGFSGGLAALCRQFGVEVQ